MASNPFKPNSRAAAPARGAARQPRQDPGFNPVKPGSYPRRPTPKVYPLKPWKPTLPKGPLFPGKLPKQFKPPFGKRVPLNIPMGFPRGFPFGKLLPWIGPGIMLAEWMLLPQKGYSFPSNWKLCFSEPGPRTHGAGPTFFGDQCNGLGYLESYQPTWFKYGEPIHIVDRFNCTIFFGPEGPTDRMTYLEKWNADIHRAPDWVPYDIMPKPAVVVPLDEWPLQPPGWLWPWIDPLAPEPFPWPPPIKPGSPHAPAPNPGENPSPEPQPEPLPEPELNPPTKPGSIPSVDLPIDPGMPLNPEPEIHEPKPPEQPDKEKKKRLNANASYKWLKFLKKTTEEYMEIDDVVAAIYKGLSWKVRRWRGRDGVWRDRDITTSDRLLTIYKYLGKLDIQTAIQNVAKNEFTDRAYGKLGNTLKKRARELGDDGYWASSGGFQRGESLKGDQWKELYDKLKRDAAKNIKPTQYTVREYNEKTGQWITRVRNRTLMRIPWFQQVSNYPLTYYDKHGTPHMADRYYYAANPSRNPIGSK